MVLAIGQLATCIRSCIRRNEPKSYLAQANVQSLILSQAMLVMLEVWSPPKVLGLIDNMRKTLDFQSLLGERVERHGTLILMMWHQEGSGITRNI